MMLNDLEDRGDTNDSSEGAPGDVMEGRATMVPPTSLSTYVSLLSKKDPLKLLECKQTFTIFFGFFFFTYIV